jgi:hypothetical protein
MSKDHGAIAARMLSAEESARAWEDLKPMATAMLEAAAGASSRDEGAVVPAVLIVAALKVVEAVLLSENPIRDELIEMVRRAVPRMLQGVIDLTQGTGGTVQ